MTKRPIFKITGDFSENACFENHNKTSEFMKFRRFAVFSNLLGHKDHIQIEILLNNSFNKMFVLKNKILKFYTQNRAWYPIYDKTMQPWPLLEGKTTELKQFLKSIIFNPKNCK